MTKLETSLTNLKDGKSGVIITVNTISNPHHGRHRHRMGFEKRLEDMGLTPGTRVTMVKSAPFRGPVEIQVRGSRLVIGRRMAQGIMVRTLSDEKTN